MQTGRIFFVGFRGVQPQPTQAILTLGNLLLLAALNLKTDGYALSHQHINQLHNQ
jgi:hypothetical protein